MVYLKKKDNLHLTNIKERNDDMFVKRPIRCGNFQKVILEVNRGTYGTCISGAKRER